MVGLKLNHVSKGAPGGFTLSLLVILNKAILWTVFENGDNLEAN